MKMEEEKKSKLTNLLIVILGGVAIILIILLLVRSRGVVTPVTRYNDYEDHLIQITKEEQIDVKANIYDDKKSLAVLLASQLEENHLANIQVKVIDENEKEIYQKEEKVVLLGGAKTLARFSLPEITDTTLKDIDIQIKTENISITTDYDSFQFTPQINTKLGENKETNVEVKWSVSPSKTLNNVSGTILLMKDDKVVASTSFMEQKVEQGSFITNAQFRNIYQNNELKALDYDKVEAFISSYEISQ